MPGEFEYIAWLRARTPTDSRVLIGPGDDCAAIQAPSRPLLITTDMLMDGTDFILADVGPRRAGRKAMAANLSDIAAMAGVPIAAVVSVALPCQPTPPAPLPAGRGELACGETGTLLASESSLPSPCREGGWGGGSSLATELYLGLRDVADAFGVALVGGDTNSWDGKLVISVTAF